MRAPTALWILVAVGIASAIGPEGSNPSVGPAAMPTAADSLLAEGEASYWDGEFETAAGSWTSALDAARRSGDRGAEARALTWLGLAAYRTGDLLEARSLGEAALALKLRLGPGTELSKSYNALGLLEWSEGRLAEAAALFGEAAEAARSEGELEMLAKTANNLGLVYGDQGEFERARASFEESHEAGRRLGDAVIEGRTLNNLGMLEIQVGDPAAGIRLLERARSLYRTTGDATGELATMGQLAAAYAATGEPRPAFAVLDSALAIGRSRGAAEEVAAALVLLGDLYGQAGDRPRALDLLGQARALHQDLGLSIEEGMDLARRGEIRVAMGDLRGAREDVVAALDVHRSAGAVFDAFGDLLLLSEIEHRDGNESAADGTLAEAETLARALGSRAAREVVAMTRARIADRRSDSDVVLRALDAAAEDLRAGSWGTRAEAENLRARAHARRGEPELAIAAGERSVAAVERAREALGSGFLRTTFLSERRRPYADLIDVLLGQGRVEAAFEVADAARGRAFLDHLTGVPARSTTGDASIAAWSEGRRLLGEIDRLVRMRDEIEAIPAEESGPADARNAGDLTRRLNRARARYEELVVRDAEGRSTRGALLGGRRARGAEVRAALGPDERLIEYFVSPERVLAFVASREAMEAIELDVAATDLARRIEMARTRIATPPTGASSERLALESLHDRLLAPVLAAAPARGGRRFVLVLDAPMADLPVAALRDRRTGTYLVERHALIFLPNAGALPLLRGRAGSAPGQAPIAVYVPFPGDLPGTVAEGRAIAASRERTKIVSGSRATERALREEMGGGRTIHVASHAVLEPEAPLFSRIDLHRRGADPDDDGRLEVHEVLGLSIRSPLVFLSGCETGPGSTASGAVVRGEEYATLARAFLYAGAGSVIATQWRIDDEAATRLAAAFHRHLPEVGPAEALARAQREMIRSDRYASPYFWAAYRMAGAEPR